MYTEFKNWLHNTDPWAFRVSDVVFTLAMLGLEIVAFVVLPATTAICLVPIIVIAWLTGFVMNR